MEYYYTYRMDEKMEEEKKLSDVLEDKNNKEKFLNKKYFILKLKEIVI